eukprot:8943868-Pyramimonas_sp.AAC.1
MRNMKKHEVTIHAGIRVTNMPEHTTINDRTSYVLSTYHSACMPHFRDPDARREAPMQLSVYA